MHRIAHNKVYIETLGCAKNRVDSEVMLNTLLESSYQFEPNPKKADVLILNTCAFLTEAVEESIDAVLRLSQKKDNPEQKLVVVGCLVERYKEKLLAEMPEIDGLLGTSDYTKILELVEDLRTQEERTRIEPLKPSYNWNNYNPRKILSTEKHYAYLKIAEGCNNSCAFCNIPKLRGRQKSLPLEKVLAEYQGLLQRGIKEINLLSQDTSNWGKDLTPKDSLLNLIRTLLEKTQQDAWLRILYSYPNDYPLELFSLMRSGVLTPYIDMPFQHIDDQVLKTMQRRISQQKIEAILEHGFAEVPNLAVRTTFIVGFPTETEQAFAKLLTLVERGLFEHVGVFCYSDEENIKSHALGDPIPKKEKLLRRKLIMEAAQKVSLAKNQAKLSQAHKVLIAGKLPDGSYKGRLASQAVDVDGEVYVEGKGLDLGCFYPVLLQRAEPYDLFGKVVPPL